ncbi:hypothetical protein OG930_44965 [Streptomyces sp. NBC_01799]|uniref:hypothetical protein n=1 Tax=Streptomyces sp. NBC_01800 TaxID=2975945 RepID=UPI002DD95CA6|nr:hypothetical protein [Streptomyces sp. NBC_01800]WSA65643.1 hypothetical protein OIE65_00495 [Streptomyces sp. NBC_01800]WSA73474.1 hypothetical protein OIE65_45565 [Streptomyces sp. NBC_01800]WSA74257.1 hypothetical protein OG930_00495 [Streptomyces sp. NBC_01799]WSA81990.1 hypothetical protein OG930_44965 [Streptomyces sp. NBC_01799]
MIDEIVLEGERRMLAAALEWFSRRHSSRFRMGDRGAPVRRSVVLLDHHGG